MTDKTAEQTTAAFRKILTRNNGVKPKQISCDLGREFSGKFAQFVEDAGIQIRLKDPQSVNSIAIVDRSIQSLKQIIASLQMSSNAPWSSLLKKANTILVDREHSALYGESPEGVSENPQVQYLLEAQAGKDVKHNNQRWRAKAGKLIDKGAFRVRNRGRSGNALMLQSLKVECIRWQRQHSREQISKTTMAIVSRFERC